MPHREMASEPGCGCGFDLLCKHVKSKRMSVPVGGLVVCIMRRPVAIQQQTHTQFRKSAALDRRERFVQLQSGRSGFQTPPNGAQRDII